jgi:hypothetical protein
MTLDLPLFTAIFGSLSLSQSSSAHLVAHKTELTQGAYRGKDERIAFQEEDWQVPLDENKGIYVCNVKFQ